MVTPESVFVKIMLQVIRRNCMINAAYPVLSLRPKPFDCISMCVTDNVNLFGMRNRFVFAAHDWKRIISSKLVSIDLCIL